MEDLLWLPTRVIQVPTSVPSHVMPIIMSNNVKLATKPASLPPSPQIVQTLKGTSTGFQFSFNQVQLPIGATNVITSYRVYRNTQNVFGRTLVHTFAHDPTHQGAIVFTDTIIPASGLNYYYWVTSVDTTGQESNPQPAQSGTVAGSAGSTPFSTSGTFAYTSTSTSITWFWDGTNGSQTLPIYRADGTITGPVSGNQTITGLSPSTTYNFYPYWDEPTQSIKWVAGGSGSPAYAQPSAGSKTLVQQQNLRTRIPLSIGGMQAATTASGSGSGSGGGGGGGGGCFTGNVRVKTSDHFKGYTYKRFDELPNIVEIENLTGVHKAVLLTHEDYTGDMIDMHGGELVTVGHGFKRDDEWIPADDLLPWCCTRIKDWKGTVYNLHVLSDNPEDHHYVLEGGLVAHNFNKL